MKMYGIALKGETMKVLEQVCLFSVNDVDAEDENDGSISVTDLFLGAKFYIIVGCVAALLALALLQASCTIYRSSRRRATKVHVGIRTCTRVRRKVLLFFLHTFFSFSTFCRIPRLLFRMLCSALPLTVSRR